MCSSYAVTLLPLPSLVAWFVVDTTVLLYHHAGFTSADCITGSLLQKYIVSG